MSKNKTIQEIKKILEEYRHSNLSGAAFCRERKIALPTFYKWNREKKLKESKDKINFIPLSIGYSQEEIASIKQQKNESIILKMKEGVSIKIPLSISSSWLSSLLKELK